MSETRREKFQRLAVKRVNNALKAIELVGNLSNRANYDYAESDVNKIFDALGEELRKSKTKFIHSANKKRNFEL